MSEKSLNQLFESGAKVRILKLFLQNPNEELDLSEVTRRSRVSRRQCLRYIKSFVGIGFIKPVITTRNAKKDKKKATSSKKVSRR